MQSLKRTRTWLMAAVLVLLVWTTGSVVAGPPDHPAAQEGVGAAAVVTPLLQYQGRLTDPGTGDPVGDGVYEMRFRLYDAASGGTSLWTETEDVSVSGGLFSTVLGDASALNPALFNGQALWLGIKVGADAEATPRQAVLPVAYALSLVPGAIVQSSSGPALQVNRTGGGEALHVGGDLNVSGNLQGGSHTHSGEQITAGIVAEPHIDAAIARDAELDGVVGEHSRRPDAHHPRYTDAEAWNAVLGMDGPGSGLNADLLDGVSAGDLAAAGHIHDERYFTEAESEARYVNASGDTMSGALTVPQIRYSAPRKHYFIVGSEGFVPGSNVAYVNTYGNGGAYVNASGCHALVAPVHLPHGATVASFTVYFQDDATGNLSVNLMKQFMTGGGYVFMSTLDSSGRSGYFQLTDTSITDAEIDNLFSSYHVYAYSCDWTSTLRIKGALVTYTIAQAD